jgi:hypothetical protein
VQFAPDIFDDEGGFSFSILNEKEETMALLPYKLRSK